MITTLLVSSPASINAQQNNNPQDFNRTIVFGLREETPPVSYNPNLLGNWQGYCYDFIKLLETDIKNKAKVNGTNISNFRIDIKTVTLDDRFTGYRNQGSEALDAECGPNTINPEREENLKKIHGKFSLPFAITGAKILLKNDQVKNFYSLEPFKGKTIGVLSKTTTNSFIAKRYPLATFKQIERKNIIPELEGGGIDAYVTDDILLKGILDQMNLWQRTKYTILPKFTSLSYETYGIVTYHNDAQNQQLYTSIDKLIKEQTEKDATNEYQFPNYLPISWIDKIYGIYYRFDSYILILIIVLAGLSIPTLKSLLSKSIQNILDYLDEQKQKKEINDIVEQIREILNDDQNNLLQEEQRNKITKKIENIVQELESKTFYSKNVEPQKFADQVVNKIKKDPSLKNRVSSAVKAGGYETLKQIGNNIAVWNIVVEAIRGWVDAE